ncbi:RagB/SusD family nutrient uptake outer membrane protein [Bacteroides oleiciplenus]|uniref:RagB/SusD family nutrient uptake outer membrane protein n=1 Tax=Bacteroides oleiciplenus TaxID=626931 RepID=UPI0026DC2671|nr:RagB/SusD family nutrient uptake outer membrane protein [Bacteroides oleiciplenus]
MKLLKYLFISSALFVVTSCGNDWLDLDPSTSVDTETSIKILSDVEFTLNGIYSTMQSSDAYSGRLVYYGDVTGDDMQAVSSTKRVANYYRFNFTKNDGPTSHWSYLYSIIQNCNLILMNIDKLDIEEEETAYRDDLKGEALAIRGLALFDLTRIFGYPYTKDNGASLGVPIVEGLSTIDSKPARNTVAQCYAKVIEDLSNSVELLSGDFNKGKINKWGAMVLLSRAYLYKGDNANALKTAEAAIKGAEKEGYALWTNEEYPTAWGNDASASNPGEVLFEIVNLTTDSPGKESMGYLNSKDGYDDMCITCSFYQFLKEDPKDIRLKLLSFDKKYYAYVFKYQPQQNENIEDANIPLIRLSEAYLIAAEAAVKQGDNDAAVKYLDPIVRRANPDKTVQGETITLERVLNERRKELVAEGHRMYDAVRNGLTIERVDVKDSNLTKTKHDTKYMKDINWNFYMIVLPIPKREMDANPNMIQNPEYGN